MSDIEVIKKKIDYRHKQIKELEQEEKKLKEELKQLLLDKYPHVYGILATPNKDNRVTHYACYFSSEEKANNLIEKHRESHDVDDDVGWKYTVNKIVDCSNIDMFSLDKIPKHFPYTGW
ncbi:MAG: hypothetical protein Terrestrivirus1_94 [Terrestrivirus sp.]|uniref:Uncharacterized protein n=1 Tax=Terrestrivirus sp. TaxID=2487775 RepID=A0A3G4ZK56_9VIRU|nr:MAG: hypothetical protein Terrestrivirus1_94 [Terrestrivirus sp.]